MAEGTAQRFAAQALEQAGYRIQGHRASCPRCQGSRKLTVAIHPNGLFFCHRCHFGGHVKQLAKQLGFTVPVRPLGKASIRKQRFRAWLAAKQTELADEERRLARRGVWAEIALAHFRDMDQAWDALAAWHHERRRFEVFWPSCSDKIGRYWLYRAWRQTEC